MGEMRPKIEEEETLPGEEEASAADLSGTVGAFALIMQRRQADGSVIGATAPAPGIYLLLLGALGMLVSLAGWE